LQWVLNLHCSFQSPPPKREDYVFTSRLFACLFVHQITQKHYERILMKFFAGVGKNCLRFCGDLDLGILKDFLFTNKTLKTLAEV